ncbi:dihydrodipicolinate synthetase [Hysterangium stoloniferum]|nr:dihydrodipicolinate synthetase [Hysterangium stoloniferum]
MPTSIAFNGHSAQTRPLLPGVFAPIPAFFLPETEELDLPTFESHVLRVANAGIGLVISGSMGEAHHLTHEERATLIRIARHALDHAQPSLVHVPIIAGTGAGSTKETIQLTKEAAQAGADFAIVIASGYFAGALDRQALKEFWVDVSQASPIPVMIYNYPGAAGGLDLDSDIIEELAREQDNICGVKLTCGNVGKLARIAAAVSEPSFTKSHPRRSKNAQTFLVLGGFCDFLVPSLFANAHGAITGLANLAPNTIRRLFDLTSSALSDPSKLAAAQELQGIVAHADRTVALSGIAGTKYLLQQTSGYGGVPRKPLRATEARAGEVLLTHANVVALLEEEEKWKKV